MVEILMGRMKKSSTLQRLVSLLAQISDFMLLYVLCRICVEVVEYMDGEVQVVYHRSPRLALWLIHTCAINNCVFTIPHQIPFQFDIVV